MTNLKRIRTESGRTQKEIAENAGVSLRSLQEYEQGRKPINKVAAITLYELAKALGCDMMDLLEI